MITVPSRVTDILKNNASVSYNIGCTYDINVNSMVDFNYSTITSTSSYTTINGRQPFKKLFPLDTIVKNYRPTGSGIKYAIDGDIAAGTWTDPKNLTYNPKSGNKYRVYYPSADLYYKYWITPKDTNAGITIAYKNADASAKNVLANKIVIKFEISHATPSAWTVSLDGSQVASGTSSAITSFTSAPYEAGILTLYYNGTTWSTTESSLNLSATKSFNTISMTATNPGGYIGVVEVAPHWIQDLTPYMVSMDINKESSSSSEDMLPVGTVTANSCVMDLNAYQASSIKFKTYTKTNTISADNIYLLKGSEIKAFIKMYDSQGTSTDSNGNYFKINQGLFLTDSWSISEYGDVQLFSMDSAKILQETICPDIVCEKYSAAAIIRHMLDSVGFVNYNFNYKVSGTNIVDTSIISPNYWWSDSNETVWGNIQELCRDAQISAVVDENNILQFYTRDYLYDTNRTSAWAFRNEKSGNELPNIISMQKDIIPTANQVKVIYYTTSIATYENSSHKIWDSGDTWLAAASLQGDLLATSDPATNSSIKHYITLQPIDLYENAINKDDVLYSFSGYLLINSEIVEYDAIQYSYKQIGTLTTKEVDITGPSDLLKYKGDAYVEQTLDGTSFVPSMKPTGKYRIKTRGALGTNKVSHYVSSADTLDGWVGKANIRWATK
jgi:hypothetical protein